MKISIETRYWTAVRNEVLENKVLSLEAKLILSHLSSFQKKEEMYVWKKHLVNRYGMTEEEVCSAFSELEHNELVRFSPMDDEGRKYSFEFLPNAKKWFNGLLY